MVVCLLLVFTTYWNLKLESLEKADSQHLQCWWLQVLKGHDDHVITCLEFCGNKIVSGSDDNTLKVWSAVNGKVCHWSALPVTQCAVRVIVSMCLSTVIIINNDNNNNNNKLDSVYSAVVVTSRLSEFTWFIMQTKRQAAANPQTKPTDLGCESACRLPSSTPTVAIYYYCSAGNGC